MTNDEFTDDLDHWIALRWEDIDRDYAALLVIGGLAEKITPTATPEEGPVYEFMIDGTRYSWAAGDGWYINDAERLLNVVSTKWLDMVSEIDALVKAKAVAEQGQSGTGECPGSR